METFENSEFNTVPAPKAPRAADILSAGVRSLFYIVIFFALIVHVLFGIFPKAAVTFYRFTGNAAMTLNYSELQLKRGNKPQTLYDCVRLSASLFTASGGQGKAEAEKLYTHSSALLKHSGAAEFFAAADESAVARTEALLFPAVYDTRAYVAGMVMRSAITLKRQETVNDLITEYTTGEFFKSADGYKPGFSCGDFMPHFIFGAYFEDILDAAGFTGLADGAAVYVTFPEDKFAGLYDSGKGGFTELYASFYEMLSDADSALAAALSGGTVLSGERLTDALKWSVFSEKLSRYITYLTSVIAGESGGAPEQAEFDACKGLYNTAEARYASILNAYALSRAA